MSEMITVNVRLSNADKETVEADKMGTVLDLKEAISAKLSVPSSQQRLIYKGRVLKDASTLEFYGIENDHTIHMVKSGGAAAAPTPPAATPIPATTTSMNGNPASTIPNMSAFGGMPNIPNLGGNQNAMMQQMLSNPEMMNQMLESPMMQNMMNNPEMMRNMMLNNPEMQSVLNANPQLRQALNDPAVSVKCMLLGRSIERQD